MWLSTGSTASASLSVRVLQHRPGLFAACFLTLGAGLQHMDASGLATRLRVARVTSLSLATRSGHTCGLYFRLLQSAAAAAAAAAA
eukprot:CAMPEP_0119105164 /NCGR_PEP_ID=MMETSP1180-20130426/3204_1 /TAXON_ID=3052 ORGANISM="Chlamydomonas cf sp, Strain CCMP681" /NCGR_SAMPLE_ID=MMETSP1180 /ASSEMBLY_ACC=CAM_ASM_000741 /LENGTH=85 /DNA_ID=CAMNT_0007090151 /DNA_START=217 /DNA_END=472 /DNA_ORIENTATION=+